MRYYNNVRRLKVIIYDQEDGLYVLLSLLTYGNMSRRGKLDSNSSVTVEGATVPNAADIENIVHKAVSAAVSAASAVIREEFQKLFDDLSQKIVLVEQRLVTLEEDRHASPAADSSTSKELEEIKKEIRECRIAANDNEQYSRRHNIRIRGLKTSKGNDCRQEVVEFCRNVLHLDSVDISTIEMAHVMPSRTSEGKASGSVSPAKSEPFVIARFFQRDIRDAVISRRKILKGTRYSILEDLTNLNVLTLNRIRNDDRVLTSWSWNGRLYAILRTGEKILVKPYQPISECQRIGHETRVKS
jgi:hypothetical protein